MENKLGMKYWSGCPEERGGAIFSGIEGYVSESREKVPALSRQELIRVLEECLPKQTYKFYYPYPDIKNPLMIFTDDFLPSKNSLNRNIRNLEKDRFVFFDEMLAYNSILDAGLFPEFSNAFMVCID
jgi:hypothetical protein